MFAPVEAFVGLRYIYARRGNHFIGFISLTSIAATALGIAVLVTILSIMNGFEGELRGRILGMAAHIEIGDRDGAVGDWQHLLELVRSNRAVTAAAPFISRDVLVAHRGVVRAVELRGVRPAMEMRVTTLAAHMRAGSPAGLVPGAFHILIGSELAAALDVTVGDRITVILPQPLMTPAGMVPRLKRFEIAGVFRFGLQEHDGSLALVNLADAGRLFRAGSRVDGIRVRLTEPDAAPRVKRELAATLARHGVHLGVRDWTDTHRDLFRALKTEKVVMFIILALAIGIAAFNVVAILVVAVTEKRPDIAMLNALGMEPRNVMRVFLVQGGVTGVIGVAAGLVLGYVLASHISAIVAFVEHLFGFKVLSPDVYYISTIPSQLRAGDFAAAGTLAAVLSLSAPLYPAWLAAHTPVSENLRDE